MLNLLKLLPEYFIFIQSVSEFFIVGIPSNKSATTQILSTLEDDARPKFTSIESKKSNQNHWQNSNRGSEYSESEGNQFSRSFTDIEANGFKRFSYLSEGNGKDGFYSRGAFGLFDYFDEDRAESDSMRSQIKGYENNESFENEGHHGSLAKSKKELD